MSTSTRDDGGFVSAKVGYKNVTNFPYVDEWCESLVAIDGLSKRSVSTYRERVVAMLVDQGVVDPGELTFAHIERHLKRLYATGRAESTRALTISACKRFGRYIKAHRVIEQNPADGMRAPKPYRREKDVLTRDEVQRLVWDGREGTVPRDPFQIRNRCVLWTMYILGLRIGEVPGLRMDHLEWGQEDGELVYSVLIRKAKGSREDVRMPLDPDGSRLLAYYLRPGGARSEIAADSPFVFPAEHGGMLTTRRLHSIFVARLKAARIVLRGRRVSPHTLRHTIATHLLEAGWDIEAVRDYMRHATIGTTGKYLHTADRARRSKRLRDQHPIRAFNPGRKVDVVGAMAALKSDLAGI